jgi:hypothetical protein
MRTILGTNSESCRLEKILIQLGVLIYVTFLWYCCILEIRLIIMLCYNETYAKFRISKTCLMNFLFIMVWNRGRFVAISFHSFGKTSNYKRLRPVRRIEIEKDTTAFLVRSFTKLWSYFKLRHVCLRLRLSACLCVGPHGTNLVPLEGFQYNLTLDYFSKIWQ